MRSGVIALAVASISPAAVVASILVRRTGRYRPQMWFGWVMVIIGLGLLSLVDIHTTIARLVGYLVFLGVGLGYVSLYLLIPALRQLSFRHQIYVVDDRISCPSSAPSYVECALASTTHIL